MKIQELSCIFFENRQKSKICRDVRNFLTKLKFLIYFFFATDTWKCLLRGPETITIVYEVDFEKLTNQKIKVRPITYPSIHPSIRQYESEKAWEPRRFWWKGNLTTYQWDYISLWPWHFYVFLCWPFSREIKIQILSNFDRTKRKIANFGIPIRSL